MAYWSSEGDSEMFSAVDFWRLTWRSEIWAIRMGKKVGDRGVGRG